MNLIKSKKRVADHGEVFTPPWLVDKMLDLVKGETERIDSRFLEPACGSGNFLVSVLLADNIAECRANMLEVFTDYLGLAEADELYQAAYFVLSLNLVHGDAMTMCDQNGAPISVVEWGYLGKGRFQRRNFRLDVLTGMASLSAEGSLFAGLSNHEIFRPIKSYPPMMVRDLAGETSGIASGEVA